MREAGKFILVISIIFISGNDVESQQTGTVTQNGYTFAIPEGWLGQSQEENYMMGSNTEPGIILLSLHQHKTLEGLKEEIKSELTDGYSFRFTLTSAIDQIDEDKISCSFEGFLGNEQAKGHLVGIVNKQHQGVLIIAMTTPEFYSERYTQLSKEIAQSLKFPKPVPVPGDQGDASHPLVQQFMHVKLTYMNSYYSSSYTESGISGGYSDQEVISLCNSGYFTFGSSSQVTAGGNYSSMYNAGRNSGDGSWTLKPVTQNTGVLTLRFNDGSVKEYNVEINVKGETYLNGYRYYRTTGSAGPDYAPYCP